MFHIPGNSSMCSFNTIALDLITQLPKANGHNAILTVVDQGCSRATTFIPCNMMVTGEGVALLYLKHIFPWFEVPSKVISDRDPCFTSHFVWALTMKLGIGRNFSTAFHPQTDRLTKQKNQWVEQYLYLYTLHLNRMTGMLGSPLQHLYTIICQTPPLSAALTRSC